MYIPRANEPATLTPNPPAMAGISACISGLSSSPLDTFNDWWTQIVGVFSTFENSVDNIREAFDQVMGGDNVPISGGGAEVYHEKIGGSCFPGWFPWYPLRWTYIGGGCTSASEVATVLRCYNNAVRERLIPEFAFARGQAAIEKIINTCATCSGVSYWRTRLILYLMHTLWAATPSTVSMAIIYPLAYESAKKGQAVPEDEQSLTGWFNRATENVGGAISTALTVLEWTAIIAAVGIVGYFGWQFYVATQMRD